MGRSEYVQQYEPLGQTGGKRSIELLHYFLVVKNFLAVKNTNNLHKPP